MSQSPYDPTTLEKVFELLDNKLVSLGIPGALSFVGITKARENQWREATGCFVGAAIVWIVIKLGKKFAPVLDQGLDRVIEASGKAWSTLWSGFEREYLEQQAALCSEYVSEGFNPDKTVIPLLEEVIVPLDLSGVVDNADESLRSDNLDIWKLLARSRQDAKFRQMSILAKGGMGKTTLLRHIALIYGQGKQRRHRAPTLVPVLLRLRLWVDVLTQPQPPSLPTLITEHHVPGLSKNHPLSAPSQWAEKLLKTGNALVMFDGFDEVPEEHRAQVSQWLSAQMQEYRASKSVFILSSRPAGFKDYQAKKPASPIFVKPFNPEQQELFIRRWYLCQGHVYRKRHHAKRVASERSENLITQLKERQDELGYMAENPLLLTMLVTYHRFDPTAQLPRQRLGLYQGISKLQLDDRPRARNIQMVLPYEKSLRLLQDIALAMAQGDRLALPRNGLLNFLKKQPFVQQEEVEAADWLDQMVEVSELLVEREPGDYEFPHASFQGFFAATRLAQSPDSEKSNQLVLQNWTGAIWRETVLLYTAQLSPKSLDAVIREACQKGSEAAELAALCLKEYPRFKKLSAELLALFQDLNTVATNSKYQTLKAFLKAGEWKEADNETYRLMITTVGKEKGQGFNRADLENFPCEDLKTLDQLWVSYSNGRFGFSVQKKIWQECGSPTTNVKDWDRFCVKVGWQTPDATSVSYASLNFHPGKSPAGELPVWWDGLELGRGGVLRSSSSSLIKNYNFHPGKSPAVEYTVVYVPELVGGCGGGFAWGVLFSSLAQRLVNCSTSQS